MYLKEFFVSRVLILFLALFFLACSDKKDEKTIRMAQQFGMIYAPLYVTTELGLLEQNLAGGKIKDKSGNTHKNPHFFLSAIQKHYFSSGETVAEGLLAGHLDIGCMGASPALIAIDKGADFKIAFGISVSPAQIVTMDKNIKSLLDIKDSDKIAVPSANSIQQIVLSMAGKKYFNDPHKFDKNLVSMKNPEGLIALLKGTDIKAHFSPLPYNVKAINQGANAIFKPEDIDFEVSIVCVATEDFYNNRKDEYNALLKSINQSIDLINKKDKRALNIIARVEKLKEKEVENYLNHDGLLFTTNIYSINILNEYMVENGYLKNLIPVNSLVWDTNFILN